MEKDLGMYHKYTVINKRNGEEMENAFVLRPLNDTTALDALKTYRDTLEDCNLKSDLTKWIKEIEEMSCPHYRKCPKGEGHICCRYCEKLSECNIACDAVIVDNYEDCIKFNDEEE